MNFGVRLPGPFRVGVSSSGRINAGVTAGPFSISGNVGQVGRRPGEIFVPHTRIEDAIAEMMGLGWKVEGRGDGWAIIAHGFMALSLRAERGGVTARRTTSNRTVIAWTVGIFAVVALCSVAAII